MSRAAGVAFLLVPTYAATAAAAFGNAAGLEWPADRRGRVRRRPRHRHRAARRPSLGADAGRRPRLAHRARGVDAVLAPGHALPREFSPDTGLPIAAGPDPLILVAATAVWWLATAVGIALIGLREARHRRPRRRPGARVVVPRSAASGRASLRCSGWRSAVTRSGRPRRWRVRPGRGAMDRRSRPAGAGGDPRRAGVPSRCHVVHLRRGARPDDRPDRLQPDLPVRFDRGRAAHRGPDPAGGRGRRGSTATADRARCAPQPAQPAAEAPPLDANRSPVD